MSRKKFAAGQAVEVRGVGHLGWCPATYVGIEIGGKGRHVVQSLGLGKRIIPDGRIRQVAQICTACQEPIDEDGECCCEECSTCLGIGHIRDGETRDSRKCLDCNGAGVTVTGPRGHP